jgi:hypothetical protein
MWAVTSRATASVSVIAESARSFKKYTCGDDLATKFVEGNQQGEIRLDWTRQALP